MRTRSDSTESEGSRFPDNGGRTGRKWLPGNIPKFWKSHTNQTAVINNPSTLGGPLPPTEEEPLLVIPNFEENLENKHFHEADQQLLDREKHLFGDPKEPKTLKDQDVEVNQLSDDREVLRKVVVDILKRSLTLTPRDVPTLLSAVRTICLEEEQDQQWKQASRIQPTWRPCNWKKLHDFTLHSLVDERMDSPSTSPAEQVGQSSIQADIYNMGRMLKEDLQLVLNVVKGCYPPEMDICNFYARLYHQLLSARVRKIADFGLDDKDCTFLLRWVNDIYPDIFKKSELGTEIDFDALGPLLPKKLLEPLEEQYLENKQNELATYISRVMDEAKEKWDKGEGPSREDGCYTVHVAYDIIQIINGMVTSAHTITGDLHKAQNLTCQLKELVQRFKVSQEEIIRHNRPHSKAHVKAYLGCVLQFRNFLHGKKNLFPDGVRDSCVCVLKDMKESAHTYLLSPVHKVLKPQYQKLGTKDWLNKDAFHKLLVSIETELHELEGLTLSCQQELIGQLHQEVTVEYVKRLLRGEAKLKDRDQQQKACVTVKENAEELHKLFTEAGSDEGWLKEILTKIAEVLKLQDIPAIQMQIVTLGSDFPDFSEKHVSALLKLKTNLSKANRRIIKTTVLDTLKEASLKGDSRKFFCYVKVK
ncbi:tumor necrosis factor alpha-induced protein 2 [Pholidichthys leucotaenia]